MKIYSVILILFAAVGVGIASFADEKELASADFMAQKDGEALAAVRLSTPEFDWKNGKWETPLILRLDGKSVASIIPFRGSEPAEYTLMLGPVEKGNHVANLSQMTDGKELVVVESMNVSMIYKDDERCVSISHAPFLLGREDNAGSDVPLLAWMEISGNGSGTEIEYSMLWSNEDGGTPTAELMARYGRTVDIEWIYRVLLDEQDNIVEEKFQGPGHKVTDFEGRRIGNHPVLRTCTVNNMVCDGGESDFIFPILPVMFKGDGTRETMLDGHPWIYRVMFEELEKEEKITKHAPDPMRSRIADPRRYALVDLDTEYLGSGLKLEVSIKIKGEEKWYTADLGDKGLLLGRGGRARVGVLLPGGTRPEDIAGVRLGVTAGSGFISVKSVGPIIMLDGGFRTHSIILDWRGQKSLKTGGKPVRVKVAD